LRETHDIACQVATQGEFGLFGTAVAGTWLRNELGDAVSFFVDEDDYRIGKEFMSLKVYHPRDVPSAWHVFIAFPFSIAIDIWKRLKSYPAQFHLPPNFE
jgi:hypothetical protein